MGQSDQCHIVSLVTPDRTGKESARNLLQEIIHHEPYGVIVFAHYGDGTLKVHVSGQMDKLKIIGALEAAKMEVWNG